VAYVSGEVGRDEVFLTCLPTGDGKWQLSTEAADGRCSTRAATKWSTVRRMAR
jgi:hypothetical protein